MRARALAACLAVALAAAAGARAGSAEAEASARTALDAFMTAFNARDLEAWRASLHWPHVRIASGAVKVWEQPADYTFDFDAFAKASGGWHHSAWEDLRVIQSSPDKVHFAVRFTRFGADGHWGVQARSSFAP